MKHLSKLLAFLILNCSFLIAHAQDYTITTTVSAIIITDATGSGETMAVNQNSTNIRFIVTPTSRTVLKIQNIGGLEGSYKVTIFQ